MVEKLKNTLLGEECFSEREKKIRVLEEVVENDRIQPINFIGKRYFTKDYIDKANRELSSKLLTERGIGDEDSRLAEWEFTYALNHEEVLPNCRTTLYRIPSTKEKEMRPCWGVANKPKNNLKR